MKRKVKIVLDNGGGEFASASTTVVCDSNGDIFKNGDFSKWAVKQISGWPLREGDTITIRFVEPLPE
jgi:hypothetical protein